MRKMRKIKLIAFLLSVTSCLFLLSTGFATWYNVNFPEGIEDKEGSFEAYDVLTISNVGMDMFQFSMFSFKTAMYEGATLTKFEDSPTGVISVTYRIPAETLAVVGNSFKVETSLSYAADTLAKTPTNGLFGGLTLNAANNGISVSCTATTGTVEQVMTTTVNGSEITSAYQFTGVTANAKSDTTKSSNDVYEFTITYTFTISSGTNFKNTFGQYLKGTEKTAENQTNYGTKFIASAHVTDIAYTN